MTTPRILTLTQFLLLQMMGVGCWATPFYGEDTLQKDAWCGGLRCWGAGGLLDWCRNVFCGSRCGSQVQLNRSSLPSAKSPQQDHQSCATGECFDSPVRFVAKHPPDTGGLQRPPVTPEGIEVDDF